MPCKVPTKSRVLGNNFVHILRPLLFVFIFSITMRQSPRHACCACERYSTVVQSEYLVNRFSKTGVFLILLIICFSNHIFPHRFAYLRHIFVVDCPPMENSQFNSKVTIGKYCEISDSFFIQGILWRKQFSLDYFITKKTNALCSNKINPRQIRFGAAAPRAACMMDIDACWRSLVICSEPENRGLAHDPNLVM